MKELKKQLSQFIREMIVLNEWSNTQAATDLGISPNRVGQIINDDFNEMTLDYLIAQADKLGATVNLEITA